MVLDLNTEFLVERDTIMTGNVSTSRVGRTAVVESCLFQRVIVYHKSYNKWFITGDAHKWGEMIDNRKKKKCTVALQRVEMNVLNEL